MAATKPQPGPTVITDSLRIPPHSIEAEQAVLGGLMLEASAWDAIADVLTAEDFYRADHRLIFGAAAAVAASSQPIDVLTLSEHLERHALIVAQHDLRCRSSTLAHRCLPSSLTAATTRDPTPKFLRTTDSRH